MKDLTRRLRDLPKAPGVYFFRSKSGEIIYVGKAAALSHRIKQYFQKSRVRDAKTDALIGEIAGIDWMVVDSELEALFLEAEMIRRYLPRYNILLRDDKSMVYIRVDYHGDHPTVSTTRRPLDDGARYYGPYLGEAGIRQAMKYLRRIFPFATGRAGRQKRVSLHYHLGLDPGLEAGKTSLEAYRANLRRLMAVIEGRRKSIDRELEKTMKQFAKNSQFEEAAKVRNQLLALRELNRQVIFGDKQFQDITKDHALVELAELLGLGGAEPPVGERPTGKTRARREPRPKAPRRIECYDVSHMSGTDVATSMVVFANGVPSKNDYRKFKARLDRNDDFYHIRATLARRFTLPKSGARGQAGWKLKMPDLIVIDGGKGQLSAALDALDQFGLAIPVIALAKREETIIISQTRSFVRLNAKVLDRLGGLARTAGDFVSVSLPKSTNSVKLLQRLRDEAHRFAIGHHSALKTRRQTVSLLDNVPSIGPVSRRKLMRAFGGARGVMRATDDELAAVLGVKRAQILRQYLRGHSKAVRRPDMYTDGA